MTEQCYFKDAHGKYTFPGQRECDHCEGGEDCITPTREYMVSYDNEPAIPVRYCLQCAHLAAIGYSGNVSSIEPERIVGLEVDGWRLWDDGQVESKQRWDRSKIWRAPVRGETVPLQILELAEEVDLELWGWRDKGELRTSESVPFRNLLTFAYIWEREEDGHTYWRTHDGWMAAPTLTNGDPDWEAAGYVFDHILSPEAEKQLHEWLQEKP